LHEARICKTPGEVTLIRRACAISSRAHELVMRVLGVGVKAAQDKHKAYKRGSTKVSLPGEWLIEKEAEAEALFIASCKREG
jgi:Xaa-Pro dipeptidase